MTEQQDVQPNAGNGPVTPGGGAPNPVGTSRRARLWQRTAGTAAVVAVLVVSNATTASAAARPSGSASAPTSTAPTSTAPTSTAPTSTDPTTTSALLHGEFKVINRDGSAQLRRWQSGTVDAIDEISVTVRSADGFDGDYLLGPGVSITGIGLGDEVTIVGAGQSVPTSS
jgi:hypothetical protein